ncbi:uncharacterized protein [Blastocystis hominis]|uniref:Ubiquitin-related modifier 1 homolog n=1 Tax=Blastocystis hominis TaxID=12968 RepID=D8LWF5_BLAHO|nr:uncharacterized protein [Blastocystis hominis]CBK20144.2 unnamed protein product [Blastocystis hominis]|eukprot:XP_012894192.1 uncharacterized protein [Blastocystis hominis]
MDVLFGGRQKLDLDVSLKTIEELIVYLKEKELSEREELFVEGTNLRSGILVLVNDVDWEVLDREKTELNEGDDILFLSTLHGG